MSGYQEPKWLRIEKVNNVTSRVTSNHPNLLSELYTYFSVYAEGYRFMPKYKMGIWDGKINFMHKAGFFPSGLLKYVYNFVKRDGLEITIDPQLTEKYDPVDFAEITEEWLGQNGEEENLIVPRDHQVNGAIKALTYNRCILEHATASGKSLTIALTVMYNLIKERCSKVLILVPSLGLVKQMQNDFKEYGIPEDMIGLYCGFQKDEDCPIIISTWQSMYKQKELTETFDMIVADEVHGLKGNTVRSVAENAVNCKIRIGCTGSMPDGKADKFLIEGALGPVIDVLSAKDLIDAGHASEILIRIPYIFYDQETKSKVKGITFDMEKDFLENHEPRNNIIKVIAKKHIEVDHNNLILVDHVDHAQHLFEKIQEIGNGVQAFIITGKTDPEERERIRQFVNENKRCVIVATYGVFSTGISIRRLHTVIFGTAGKSKIRTLQSIGRGLRLHKEKKKLTLYDIGDNLNYSDKHLQKRIELYTKSEFDISISEINLEKKPQP